MYYKNYNFIYKKIYEQNLNEIVTQNFKKVFDQILLLCLYKFKNTNISYNLYLRENEKKKNFLNHNKIIKNVKIVEKLYDEIKIKKKKI